MPWGGGSDSIENPKLKPNVRGFRKLRMPAKRARKVTRRLRDAHLSCLVSRQRRLGSARWQQMRRAWARSANLSRPGGNATGVTFNSTELGSKRLEMLRELVPRATLIAFLVNPRNPNAESSIADTQASAKILGVKLLVVNAVNASDLDVAFATIVQQRAEARVVGTDVLFNGPRRTQQLITLAAVHAVPTMFSGRDRVAAGGLISYAIDIDDMLRQAGVYIGRILKGEKPADLPVLQPTKFELAINLKTAKALGLTVPPSLLARADEVIE